MDREHNNNNVIRFPAETAAEVEAAAAAWLARVTSGALTLAELAEFAYWRAASPERERVYSALETMWERLGAGTAMQQAPRRAAAGAGAVRRPADRRAWQPRELGRRLAARWRAALGAFGGLARFGAFSGLARFGAFGSLARAGQFAVLLLAVVAGQQYLSAWRHDFHTAEGEIRRVALADGSVVHLKGGTALDVRIAATGARTVELAHGEAFFEVQHDAARPFTVVVGSGTVTDIGTGFLVSREGASVAVAVEHGIVEVAAAGRSNVLDAGEQISFNPYEMKRKLPVDPRAIASWRRGLYVAENKPLGEALQDLDEYYGGRIVVTSRALAARRVNAVVQLDHIDAWFDALNETQGVSVRRWGPITLVGTP